MPVTTRRKAREDHEADCRKANTRARTHVPAGKLVVCGSPRPSHAPLVYPNLGSPSAPPEDRYRHLLETSIAALERLNNWNTWGDPCPQGPSPSESAEDDDEEMCFADTDEDDDDLLTADADHDIWDLDEYDFAGPTELEPPDPAMKIKQESRDDTYVKIEDNGKLLVQTHHIASSFRCVKQERQPCHDREEPQEPCLLSKYQRKGNSSITKMEDIPIWSGWPSRPLKEEHDEGSPPAANMEDIPVWPGPPKDQREDTPSAIKMEDIAVCPGSLKK